MTSSTGRLSRRAWTSARKAATLARTRGTLIHWGERAKGAGERGGGVVGGGGGGEEKELRKPPVTTVWPKDL